MSTIKTFNSLGEVAPLPGQYQTHPFRVLLTVHPKGAQLLLPNASASKKSQLGFKKISIKGTTNIDITHWVTQLDWSSSDEEKYTTVKVTLDNFGGLFNQVPAGSRVIVQIRKPFHNFTGLSNGKFYPYLTAYVFEKDRGGSGDAPTMQFQCFDRMYWLSENKYEHVFKKDTKHPRGWTSTEIIRHIAKQLKIPIGTIHNSTYRHERFETKKNVISEIYRVLALDKKKTGRKAKYYVHMRDGKLNVVKQPAKPKSAYLIDEKNTLENGNLREVLGKKFATRLTVKTKQVTYKTTTRGTRVKLIKEVSKTVNPTNPAYQIAFGIIHKTEKVKGTHSAAGVNKIAKNLMAKRVRPEKEFSITTRGIPGLWPGKKVYVVSKYHGVKGLVRIKSVNYSLDGRNFTMDLGLAVDNRTILSTNQIKLLYARAPVRY